jgi:5-methylcytosine-specific restriction endonuclease McrA
MTDRALRERVGARALRRCEYCHLQQALVPLVVFHVDHIVARKHGGGDGDENLALACFHCNLHKGPKSRLSAER